MTRSIPPSVEWRAGSLRILDQTRLPGEVKIVEPATVAEVWEAIRSLRVRGAPALGIAAAYGLLVGLDAGQFTSAHDLRREIEQRISYLATARPTAINLFAALTRMGRCFERVATGSPDEIVRALVDEAIALHDEDRRICRAIGEEGKSLIRDGMNVLTHCNAGALAVSELGTALAPLYLAKREGRRFHVYVDETRPLLQGARLTAWELHESGIDITLICDNMAAQLFSRGRVDLVIVGTDRVVANGDVTNKIGTLGLAILAHHFSIPFYVACPSTTVDMGLASGDEVPIEMRDPEEVRSFNGVASTLPTIRAFNPAFDVTPANLVTGIITDRGLILPPLDKGLARLFG